MGACHALGPHPGALIHRVGPMDVFQRTEHGLVQASLTILS